MTGAVYRLDGTLTLERRGLRDRVYELVLDMLMRSGIEPGSRLSIDTIARDLGVSPTPVREALVQLERTGLVTREAHKGYRVAPPISDGQLEALFDARLVLETGATALAAKNSELLPVLEEALAQHRTMTQRVEEASAHGDIPVDLLREYFAADWNFHHEIFQSTNNPFLIDMSEAISTRVHRMRQTVSSGVSDAGDAVSEHTAIAAAFTISPEAASAAMREHINRVRERSRRDATR